MNPPRIRPGSAPGSPYPFGRIPRRIIRKIAADIVYLKHTHPGRDISPEDWPKMFADAIGASYSRTSVGLADVSLNQCCWGMKTIKHNPSHLVPKPKDVSSTRLVYGRNSLDYSFEISNVRELLPDPLGQYALGIWNARVEETKTHYSDCRIAVLIRSEDLTEFTIFETRMETFDYTNFMWGLNIPRKGNSNMEGRRQGQHKFTWQYSGSQFSVREKVPDTRVDFTVKAPQPLSKDAVLSALGYDASWITFL